MIPENINKDRLIIDFICAVYLFVFAPMIKTSTANIVYNSVGFSILLGLIVLILSVLEAIAIPPLISKTYFSAEENTRSKLLVPMILLFFLHLGISLLVVIFCFKAMNIPPEENMLLLILIIIFAIAKEIYIIKNSFTRSEKVLFSALQNQIIIALYSCLIFTIFWESNQGDVARNLPMMIINSIAMLIFFAFFYYPLRIPMLLKNYIQPMTTKQIWIAFGSFLMVFLPALLRKLGEG